MKPKLNREAFKLDTSANYRIRVQGEIDPSWSDIIGDMKLSIEPLKRGDTVSCLSGYLIDQAALSGLLKALYDQQIPILSVENTDEKKAQP